MTNTKLTVGFLASRKDDKVHVEETTWDELKDWFKSPLDMGNMNLEDYRNASSDVQKEEKDGAAWMPCSLIDMRDGRQSNNIDKAYLMVLDIDTGLSLENIEAALKSFEYALHSTYSHSAEKPKWRVIMPFMKPISPADLLQVFAYFNAKFEYKLDAKCGHDAARIYYLPRCPADAEHLFQYAENEGELLDGAALANLGQDLRMEASDSELAFTSAPYTVTKGSSFAKGVAMGSRNSELTKRAYQCHRDGLEFDAALEKCAAWNLLNNPPLPQVELRRTLKSAFKTSEGKAIKIGEAHDDVIEKMNAQVAWIDKHSKVYRNEFQDLVSADALRSTYANTSILVIDHGTAKQVTHAEAWLRSPKRRHHKDLVFVPGAPATVNDSINLWRGWPVAAVDGDIAPWTELLDHLFNGEHEHRTWFEQWLAYPIQHPGAKLNSAVAIWSARQGVGKSLIGETVGRLYGPHFKTITAAELHGQYNNWTRDCQFVLGEENASSDHRADSNKLKHLITGSTITVSEKYQPNMSMPNVMNFLFTSNHPDAFHLEDHDRRFFVWQITAARLSDDFYADFVAWRDQKGGAAALMHHFLTLDLSTFNPSANAPMTNAKAEMISQSKTSLERWVAEVTEEENVIPYFGKEVVTVEDMARSYAAENGGLPNPTALGKALRRSFNHVVRRISTKPRRKKAISLRNHDFWESADSDVWVKEYEKPTPFSLV